MSSKGGVITTAMLSMENQCNIQNLSLQLCILAIRTQHQQNILSQGETSLRIADKQSLILTEVTVCMIGINSNLRKLGNQLQRLTQYIFRRNILRIVVVGVQSQYTALHGIHNIGISTLHNHVTDKTTAQLLHVSHNIEKSGQLIPVGKLAEDQQINNLFKAVTSAVQTIDNILYIDALVKKLSVCRNPASINQLITVYIRNLSQTGKDTLTCRITQTSFYIVFYI